MHKLFNVSIVLKGITGLFEIVLGIVAVFISRDLLLYWVHMLTRRELLQDPGDMFAQYVIGTAQQYSVTAQIFVAVYFLIHGVIKVWLLYAMYTQKMWAYPTAMFIFSLFLVYQVHEYIKAPHFSLIVLSALDIIVIALTIVEYKSLKKLVKDISET